MVAAPAVEAEHKLGHAGYTLWVFAAPMLLSALIEAPLALIADVFDRRRLLRGSMSVLGGALLLAAQAPTAWLLSLALALAGAASGVACALAQSELVARAPGDGARALSRWSAFAAAGDLLVPLLVALLAWCGLGYRAALAAIGLLLLAHANLSALGASAPREEPASAPASETWRAALGLAARRPRLWLLVLASSLCCLLDEVVVALAALHLELDQGAGLGVTMLGSTLLALGSLLGALLTERLLPRLGSRAILLSSSASCCLLLGLVALGQPPTTSLLLLGLLGLSAAPHHALLQAAAYESVPEAPGLVNAVAQPFVLVEVLLPLLIGALASRCGLTLGLLALAAQPLLVGVVALRVMRSARTGAA